MVLGMLYSPLVLPNAAASPRTFINTVAVTAPVSFGMSVRTLTARIPLQVFPRNSLLVSSLKICPEIQISLRSHKDIEHFTRRP